LYRTSKEKENRKHQKEIKRQNTKRKSTVPALDIRSIDPTTPKSFLFYF